MPHPTRPPAPSFDADYQAKYGTPAPGWPTSPTTPPPSPACWPPARRLLESPALSRPEGFAGVDGVFALRPDGTVRRGLAVFAIHRGGPAVIEPAPTALTAPGI